MKVTKKVLAVDNQDSSNRTRHLSRLIQYPHLQRKQAVHRFPSRRQAWANQRPLPASTVSAARASVSCSRVNSKPTSSSLAQADSLDLRFLDSGILGRKILVLSVRPPVNLLRHLPAPFSLFLICGQSYKSANRKKKAAKMSS